MSVLPLYSQNEPFYVPAFEVRFVGTGSSGGQPLPGDVIRDAIEVTFQDSIERVDTFSLTLSNWDAGRRAPQFLGSSDASWLRFVQPGNNIQLSMGYQGRSPDLRVMTTGPITSLEADFPESAAPRMTVGGSSALENFRKKQYTWHWPDTGTGITESQVARDLGAHQPDAPQGRPGLGFPVRVNAQAAGLETPTDTIMMNNEYPIVFLMQLARRRGYDLFLSRDEGADASDPGYLYFGPSRFVSDTAYELEWGKTLVSFKPTIALARQVRRLTVSGWDRRRQRRIEGVATTDQMTINRDLQQFVDLVGHEEVVTDQPVQTQAEANRKAADLLNAQLQEMATATGVTIGLPDLRAGRAVQISGVDPLLDGRWFVKETTHTINDGGYRTTFTARREELS
jgi:phage protein D